MTDLCASWAGFSQLDDPNYPSGWPSSSPIVMNTSGLDSDPTVPLLSLERLSWNRAAGGASGAGVVHNDEGVPAPPEGLETLTGEPRVSFFAEFSFSCPRLLRVLYRILYRIP